MGRGRGAHVSTDERIEQALAWGRSHSWIRRTLNVGQDEIAVAIDRMDQACADDLPLSYPQAGTRFLDTDLVINRSVGGVR